MGLTSKAFSDIITFSRSSNATRVGPDGKIAYAPHNLLTYSEQLDNAAWNQASLTVTANATAAPNGTATADKLIANTTNTYHQVSESVTTVASVVYAFSVYLKMGESRYANLLMNNNGGFSAIGVDMQAGTIVTNSVGVTQTTGSIQSVGNGWYRATVFVQAASTSIDFRITASNSANTSWSFAGDGSSGFYAWGAQVSAGSIAGDYTPTTSAAVYGPRFDYDPVTLAAKGLLIEEQRTNLITYSEQFDNAAWTKGDITVTANTTTAPDGTTTAEKITESATNFSHLAYQSFSASATAYTVTVYAKAAERSWIYLRFDTDAPVISAWYNLSTGTVGTVGSGVTASITSVGNGWYRCTYTRTATATTQYAVVGVSNADGTAFYTGDGTSGVYVWGAQLEAGAFATSYIPTVASSVTRSADVASVNTLSPWFNAVEGTLFAQFDEYISSSSITNQVFASLNDGTANNEMLLYRSGGGFDARFAILTSGALQADVATSITIAQNTAYKTAGAYKLNDIAASTSGNTPGTDTSATIPTVSALQIGGGRGTTAFSGHLRRLAYYPRRLTNAELQALTA